MGAKCLFSSMTMCNNTVMYVDLHVVYEVHLHTVLSPDKSVLSVVNPKHPDKWSLCIEIYTIFCNAYDTTDIDILFCKLLIQYFNTNTGINI